MKAKLRNHLDGWVRLLRGLFLLCFDSLVLAGRNSNPNRTEGAIFCLHGLGDLLLAGHAVTGLSANMRARGLRTVLFVHPEWVAFARRYLDVDAVEGIDRHRFTRKFGYRTPVLKSVAGRFAMAVQPTYNRMLRVEDCLLRATRAPVRIGNAGHAPFISAPERWCGDRAYTQIIVARPVPLHELERYAEFMAGIGLSVPVNPWPLMPPSAPRRPAMLPDRSYLVVAPNASGRRRSWPLENFLQVARQIAPPHNLAVVIVADEKWPLPSRQPDDGFAGLELIDLSGQIPTEDLPAILARAELVLANDSGIYHLGVSLQRPTLAVGGSGLPTRYFPYPHEASLNTRVIYRPVPCAGCNWRCIHTTSRAETAWCLQQITCSEVAGAATQFLTSTI